MSPEVWTVVIDLVLMPLGIAIARLGDVSLGTLRIVFVAQGRGRLALITGFFESLIWLLVISQILQRLDSFLYMIAYAAGFAAGNYLGLVLERRLAMGLQMVRIILRPEAADALTAALQDASFGYTVLDARGAREEMRLLYTVVRRRDVQRLENLVQEHAPRAFVSVEDVRRAIEGVFPPTTQLVSGDDSGWRLGNLLRKRK